MCAMSKGIQFSSPSLVHPILEELKHNPNDFFRRLGIQVPEKSLTVIASAFTNCMTTDAILHLFKQNGVIVHNESRSDSALAKIEKLKNDIYLDSINQKLMYLICDVMETTDPKIHADNPPLSYTTAATLSLYKSTTLYIISQLNLAYDKDDFAAVRKYLQQLGLDDKKSAEIVAAAKRLIYETTLPQVVREEIEKLAPFNQFQDLSNVPFALQRQAMISIAGDFSTSSREHSEYRIKDLQKLGLSKVEAKQVWANLLQKMQQTLSTIPHQPTPLIPTPKPSASPVTNALGASVIIEDYDYEWQNPPAPPSVAASPNLEGPLDNDDDHPSSSPNPT